MSEEKKDQPIIVVKKNVKHGGHHGGAWKVAYADFVTAMMAFFLVMWLVTQSDAVKQAVAGYFNDPAHFSENYKKSIMKGGSGLMKNESPTEIKQTPPQPQSDEEKNRKEMEDLAARLRKAIDDMPGMNVLRKYVDMEVTHEGLRIQLIEGSDESFFKPGSSLLSLKGELILKVIAMELKKLPNSLVIEGHTDAVDLGNSEDYTNFELSSDRANAARRVMTDGGLRKDQVYQVRGYAANKPRIRDNPSDPRNRRITILVLNRFSGAEAPDDTYQSPIIMEHPGDSR
jgi:chemotaxis protein MotB